MQREFRSGQLAGSTQVLPVIPPRGVVPQHIDDRLSRAAQMADENGPAARNLLFAAYWPRLRRICFQVWRRSCQGTIVDRDDVEQEAFLVFAELLEQWSANGSFSRYLLGTFPWRLRDAVTMRIGPRRDASLSEPSLAERAGFSFDAEQAVKLLEELAQQFPPLDRQMLLMRVRDGYGVRQIATALKINRRTIQRRMAPMRAKLRADLLARTSGDA